MYWNDLNKDNIEQAKELYYDYLQDNKENNNVLRFDEYLEDKVVKCERCENLTLREHYHNNGYLCQCCYDDINCEYEEDEHDKWLDKQNGVI